MFHNVINKTPLVHQVSGDARTSWSHVSRRQLNLNVDVYGHVMGSYAFSVFLYNVGTCYAMEDATLVERGFVRTSWKYRARRWRE